MSKAEFLEKLSEALRENMDDRSAYEHISYYSNYIDEEVRKGKSEEEVTLKLGNPRLIAKSIVDRGGYARNSSAYTSYDTKKADNTDYRYDNNQSKGFTFSINGKSINPMLAKVAGIVILVLLIALVCLVLWGISMLVLKVIIPVLIVVFFVGLVMNIIKSSKK